MATYVTLRKIAIAKQKNTFNKSYCSQFLQIQENLTPNNA